MVLSLFLKYCMVCLWFERLLPAAPLTSLPPRLHSRLLLHPIQSHRGWTRSALPPTQGEEEEMSADKTGKIGF